MKNLVGIALLSSLVSLPAFAVDQDFGILNGRSKLELLNDISSTCVLKIDGQIMALKDIENGAGEGISTITLKTDAADREDGVRAEVSFNFGEARLTGHSNVRRYSKLLNVNLRAFNDTIWFGVAKQSNIPVTTSLLLDVVKKRPLKLSALAYLEKKSDRTAVATLECNVETWAPADL